MVKANSLVTFDSVSNLPIGNAASSCNSTAADETTQTIKCTKKLHSPACLAQLLARLLWLTNSIKNCNEATQKSTKHDTKSRQTRAKAHHFYLVVYSPHVTLEQAGTTIGSTHSILVITLYKTAWHTTASKQQTYQLQQLCTSRRILRARCLSFPNSDTQHMSSFSTSNCDKKT